MRRHVFEVIQMFSVIFEWFSDRPISCQLCSLRPRPPRIYLYSAAAARRTRGTGPPPSRTTGTGSSEVPDHPQAGPQVPDHQRYRIIRGTGSSEAPDPLPGGPEVPDHYLDPRQDKFSSRPTSTPQLSADLGESSTSRVSHLEPLNP